MPFVDRAARPRRPREPENSGRGRERERDSGDPGTARVCARGGGGVPGRGLDVCVGGRGGEGGSRRHGVGVSVPSPPPGPVVVPVPPAAVGAGRVTARLRRAAPPGPARWLSAGLPARASRESWGRTLVPVPPSSSAPSPSRYLARSGAEV